MRQPDIQLMLEAFQEALGEKPHVYFQPPDSAKIVYPCFIYTYSDTQVMYSNNIVYLRREEYLIKYISKKADPPMLDSILALTSFNFDRHYVADGLNHYTFTFFTPYTEIQPQVDLRDIEKKYIGG